MNWEVWIMKSKTCCFNKTIFKKNMTHKIDCTLNEPKNKFEYLQ